MYGYLKYSSSSRQPLVIYGESGCGKTSVMAKVASQAHTWMSHTKPVLILRFLGMYIYKVLQICTIYVMHF